MVPSRYPFRRDPYWQHNGKSAIRQDVRGGTNTGYRIQNSGEIRFERETVWLTQRQMASLSDKDTGTIGLRIWNVFRDGELDERSTTEDSSVAQ
jgi:hypothetical protein